MKRRSELELVAAESGRIALMAADGIKKALDPKAGGPPDTKAARDLSAIVKDMVALSRELSAGEEQHELRVSFSDETAGAAQ